MQDGKVDTEALKASVDIVDVIGERLQLKRVGKEYKGICPWHSDSDPSLCVIPEKQMWFCHICNLGGDSIAFVMRFENCDFKSAISKLGGPINAKNNVQPLRKSSVGEQSILPGAQSGVHEGMAEDAYADGRATVPDELQELRECISATRETDSAALQPVRESGEPKAPRRLCETAGGDLVMPSVPSFATRAPPIGTAAPQFGNATASWCYRDLDGRELFYVARYDRAEKDSIGKPKKDFHPFTWHPDDGWQRKAWPAPRPMYGLQRLKPDRPIVIVSGEKCADAGALLFPDTRIVMSWCGGEAAIAKTDFSPCRQRKVFIWPDADEAGTKCTVALTEKLRDLATEVWIFNVDDMPRKWDVADAVAEGWDYAKVKTWIRDKVGDSTRLRRHVYTERVAAPVATLMPREELPTAVATVLQAAVARASQQTDDDKAMNALHWDLAPWRRHLVMGGKEDAQRPIKCVANCIVPFRYDPKWEGVLRWDEMAETISCAKPTPWGEIPEQWNDHHDVRAAEWLDRSRMHYSSGLVREAIRRVAKENSFHPVREYLNALQWDGVKRLDHWLTDYCNVASNAYTNFIGKACLVGGVGRAMLPGCNVKSMLILEGSQDCGKSQALAILGGTWYGPQHGSIQGDAQKAKEQCTKLWLIEMAELATIRESSVETLKDFVSTAEDTYRPAYGHYVGKFKRCCFFVGTCNPGEFLRDDTGNVRFWPATIQGEIDLSGLRRDRDQLWAEAAVAYRANFEWWMTDPEIKAMAAAEADAHMVDDEWRGIIQTWLDAPEQRVRTWYRLSEVIQKGLGVDTARIDAIVQRRAGKAMRLLGYEKKAHRDEAVSAKQFKVWVERED